MEEQSDLLLDTDKMEKAAHVLKTLAHPLRIHIANILRFNERMSVSELCQHLEAEQSLVSHHLASMRKAGVLQTERIGKTVVYSLAIAEVVKVLQCMERCNL